MRIALLTDIHGNLEALDACLADARARGAERLVILGDLVGYGADPVAVVGLVLELMAEGAVVLRGNHDEAALHGPFGFSGLAARAMLWTMEQLDLPSRRFLAGLPLTHAEEDRLYTHADASDPGAWHYVTDARDARVSLAATPARLTFCGHTHVPALFSQVGLARPRHAIPAADVMQWLAPGQRWLGVIGAVGQPRDGEPAACYGLLDTQAAECGWMRVPYDVERAAAKIRAAGLPEALAARLFEGA